MSKGLKNQIIGAFVGALVTGLISIGLFVAEKNTIEEKTVETLAGYFDSVNEEMAYDDVLKTIYEDFKRLEEENANLKSDMGILNEQYNADEINRNALEKAEGFASSNDYAMAIATLTSIANKTPEMEVLLADYTQKYESYIIERADSLKGENSLDEAVSVVNEGLAVLPNSATLKAKQQELQKSYPQKMLDVVPAYQSGGNPYTEYSSKNSGGTETFSMGGVKYTNGMTFNADENIFDDVSWAIYNLNGEYDTLEFTVCHVDGTFNGGENALQIFYDGELKEEIPLAPDMSPKFVSLDISNVVQLKMQVHSSGGDGPVYGVGNPMIK